MELNSSYSYATLVQRILDLEKMEKSFSIYIVGHGGMGKSSLLSALASVIGFEKHIDYILDNSDFHPSLVRSHKDLPVKDAQLLKRLFPKKDKQYFEIISPTDYQIISSHLPKVLFSPSHQQKLIPLDELMQPISFISSNPISILIPQRLDIDEYSSIKYTPHSTKEKKIDILLEDIYSYTIFIFLKLLLHTLKKIIKKFIQMQYIANKTINKLSGSPTPQKKEPPVGGVKVGGEHLGNHVAKGLYPLSFLMLKHSTQ